MVIRVLCQGSRPASRAAATPALHSWISWPCSRSLLWLWFPWLWLKWWWRRLPWCRHTLPQRPCAKCLRKTAVMGGFLRVKRTCVSIYIYIYMFLYAKLFPRTIDKETLNGQTPETKCYWLAFVGRDKETRPNTKLNI